MSEEAERYAREQAPILVNDYKDEFQREIDYLTPRKRGPITLKDYAHPDATPFRTQKELKIKQ